MSRVGSDVAGSGGTGGPGIVVWDGGRLHGGEGGLIVANEESIEDGNSDFPKYAADDEGACAFGQHVVSID